ncbi:GNAT family N-acetyltransferase [Kitasatospora sp. NPDC094028]
MPFTVIDVDLMMDRSGAGASRGVSRVHPIEGRAGVDVRRATGADALSIARLRAEMIKAAPTGRWFEDLTAYLVDGLARAEDMAGFVVDGPADSLASVALGSIYKAPPGPTYSGRTGYVHLVLTAPGYRRQGNGRAVTTSLLAWFWDQGCGLVSLNASADGAQLYRSLGFEKNARAMRLFGRS